jgi:hypothetical protein
MSTISEFDKKMGALFSLHEKTFVHCTHCGQMSLDEVLCECEQIIAAFGDKECKECGLDYTFLPNIIEYSAGITDEELTSYAASILYKNYVRMFPKTCMCCASTYVEYIVGLMAYAADWNNYYYYTENEPSD